MTDKELDILLKKALIQEITENDIKFTKKSAIKKRKAAKITKPFIAVAACTALFICTISIQNIIFPKAITNISENNESKDNSKSYQQKYKNNTFNIGVYAEAAEKKIIPLEKEHFISYGLFSCSSGCSPDSNASDRYVSATIGLPMIICDDENMDTITYSINNGSFQITHPQNTNFILNGNKDKDIDKNLYGILSFTDNFTSNYYKSYTVDADNQMPKNVSVNICYLSKSKELYDEYKKIENGKINLKNEAKFWNKFLSEIEITCTVKYKNGSQASKTICIGVIVDSAKNSGLTKYSKYSDYNDDGLIEAFMLLD